MHELIPPPVFESIKQHLRNSGNDAVSGWERNSDEEDSLTGDLGRLLCTGSPVQVDFNGRVWIWRVSYKKFRGRGANPFENQSGADGIIQVEINSRHETYFKGLLFQAKKERRLRHGELRKQVAKIEEIAPGGSAIVVYRAEGYLGIKGTDYLQPDASLVTPLNSKMRPLASLFDDFLVCKSGLRGMYYEAVRERLLVPTLDGQIKAIPLEVRHRIKIEVASS